MTLSTRRSPFVLAEVRLRLRLSRVAKVSTDGAVVYAMSLLSMLNGTGPNRSRPETTSENMNVYEPQAERHRMSRVRGFITGIGPQFHRLLTVS
jgi:hypothetical protein